VFVHVVLEYVEGFASKRIEKLSAMSEIDINCDPVSSGLASRVDAADWQTGFLPQCVDAANSLEDSATDSIAVVLSPSCSSINCLKTKTML
jgi:hypothetical protein